MSKEDKIVFCTGGRLHRKAGCRGAEPYSGKAAPGRKRPGSSGRLRQRMMPQSTALRTTLHWCRLWTFSADGGRPYTLADRSHNALSDVYAMGGEVKTALNLVCFPEDMDLNVLGEILRGGAEKVAEAGGSLAGGTPLQTVG